MLLSLLPNLAPVLLELHCFDANLGAEWLVWRCPWRAPSLVLVVSAVPLLVFRLLHLLVGPLRKFVVGWLLGFL
jgi:hypothetical protein